MYAKKISVKQPKAYLVFQVSLEGTQFIDGIVWSWTLIKKVIMHPMQNIEIPVILIYETTLIFAICFANINGDYRVAIHITKNALL